MNYEAPVLRTLGDLQSLTLTTVSKSPTHVHDVFGDPAAFVGSVISVTP